MYDSRATAARTDGVEDYEYFALLRELLKSKPNAEAESLLKVPPSVCTDLTHFSLEPPPLLEHRERLARAIERLSERRSPPIPMNALPRPSQKSRTATAIFS